MKLKPNTEPDRTRTATERALAARRTTHAIVTREMMLVAILSRCPGFSGHLALPKRKNDEFPWLVVLNTPAGAMAWRLAVDDLPLFAHLERQRHISPVQATDKTPTLLTLVTDGWVAQSHAGVPHSPKNSPSERLRFKTLSDYYDSCSCALVDVTDVKQPSCSVHGRTRCMAGDATGAIIGADS